MRPPPHWSLYLVTEGSDEVLYPDMRVEMPAISRLPARTVGGSRS